MKKLIFLLLAIVLGISSEARGLPRYPFVHAEYSSIQRPAGSSPDFDLFLSKLDTLLQTGRGDVRILHVGGSHVQGGTWSDRLRQRFLSLRYGIDGGRGLVFPYACVGTNTPVSYTTSYIGSWDGCTCVKPDRVLGLTGATATARDTSARFVIDLLPGTPRVLQNRYAFNRVDILGDGEMEPVLLLSSKDTLRGVTAAGITHFDLPWYMDWIQVGFKGPAGRYNVRGVYLDRNNTGFTLCETGINGASTRSWLNCDDWAQDLARVCPDLVIFSIGINDIQGTEFDVNRFKIRYRQLIQQVRRVNPHCAVLMSGINDSARRRGALNPYTAEAERAFEDLAAEYKGVFWNLYQVMGGAGSIARWQDAGLAQGDGVHFTSDGYKLLGDLLFEAIMDDYYERR